jgi:hypothetical protein
MLAFLSPISFLGLMLITLSFFPAPASDQIAIIAQKNNTYFAKISKIDKVIDHLNSLIQKEKLNKEEILVAFDWDNTLSKINGCSLPLREDSNTKEVVTKLKQDNIPFIILTSRLGGEALFYQENDQLFLHKIIFERMMISVKNMLLALDMKAPPIFDESAFYQFFLEELNGNISIGQLSPSPNDKIAKTLIYQNVVFAGSSQQSVKGDALTKIIDLQLLKHTPKSIIFIDNDLSHIEGMFQAFKNRSETIFGLYYPQDEELSDQDECWQVP